MTGSSWRAFLGRGCRALSQRKNAIGTRLTQALGSAAWPLTLDQCCGGRAAQAEMQTQVGVRRVTSAADHVSAMAQPIGRYEHLCTNGVVRALGATHEAEFQPVISVGNHVAQQSGRGIHVVDDDVEMAVIEQITDGKTSPT